MKTMPLGRSGLMVSEWCLGTMTFGTQTSEAEGHRQIDKALEAGIDFLDTAEMYPVNPVSAETVGRTEEIVGNWVAKSGKRDEVIIATKVSGKNGGFVRDGRGYDGVTIRQTVEDSLRRLQTDRIDLYQTHWPNRGSYHFRQYWSYDPSGQDRSETMDHMADMLETLDELVKAGKLRAWGLSNESAWGTTKWVDEAARLDAPRVASIQNEYSLMCRIYDTDLAEVAVKEDVTLLAFSPLAAGLLTGKYQGGAVPEGSRMSINTTMGGRLTPRALETVQAYLDLANGAGLDPVHMALAWCRTRPFPVIPIFGATTEAQLDRILQGREVVLDTDMVAAIDEVHKAHPMPF